MKNLLVLTLSSGEQDRPLVLRSLEIQTFRSFTHLEISGLGNHEAHTRLYETIQAKRNEYDYFLKLDADMVFRSDRGLAQMISEMSAVENCDHATWHVLDFLSETKIWGIHMFSNRARWAMPLPALFVDPIPSIPGRRMAFPVTHESHILHAAFPSKKQAFQFGVHRGTKCFAQGSKTHCWAQRYFQYNLLSAVWEMFLRTKDTVRGMAMMGAERARTGLALTEEYRRDASALQHFEAVQDLPFFEIQRRCNDYWGSRRSFERVRHWYHYKLELLRARKISFPSIRLSSPKTERTYDPSALAK